MVGFSRNWENPTAIELTTTTTTNLKLYHGVREWEEFLETGKSLTVIELTYTYTSISGGISRGFEIFRLLSRPFATADWRHKEESLFLWA